LINKKKKKWKKKIEEKIILIKQETIQTDEWDNVCIGKDILIKDKIINKGTSGYESAFSKYGISSGNKIWKIKVLNTSDWSVIGVIPKKDKQKIANDHLTNSPHNGRGYHYTGKKIKTGNFDGSYGQPFTNGDIISIHLNMDNKTLAFSKNDSYYNVAYSDLLNEEYYLGVTLGYSANASYEML